MSFLFGKRPSKSEQKQQAKRAPYIVDEQLVARVDDLMAQLNAFQGNTDILRSIARSISSLAGLESGEQILDRMREGSSDVMQWPWQMLADVAVYASHQGKNVLVGRIFGFTFFWKHVIFPQLTQADWFDLFLDPSPPALEVKIASVALGPLQQLPTEQVILDNPDGALTTQDLLLLAAKLLM